MPTTPIEYPIVNHLGELHSRTAINIRSDDTYQLIKDVPVLVYSSIVDSSIAITEVDGRLYDVKNLKYLEVGDLSFKSVVVSVRANTMLALTTDGDLSFKSVVISAYENMMLALTTDGDLYQSDVTVHNFKLIDRNVQFITRGYYDDLVSVKKSQFTVHKNEDITITTLPKDEEVIEVRPGILITHSRLIILMCGGMSRTIELKGRLIGCGIIMVYCDHVRNPSLVIMEEVDGELITQYCYVKNSHHDDLGYEVYNSQLVRMHRESPWTEIITINGNACLLNRDGLLLDIEQNWMTIGMKIPFNILSTNNRPKSMI